MSEEKRLQFAGYQTPWKKTSVINPPPPRKLPFFGPPSPRTFRCPPRRGEGMDIFWNYTLQRNWLRCHDHFLSPLEVLFFCFSFVRGNAKYTRGPNPDRIFMYGIQMINKFSLVWNKPIRNTFLIT